MTNARRPEICVAEGKKKLRSKKMDTQAAVPAVTVIPIASTPATMNPPTFTFPGNQYIYYLPTQGVEPTLQQTTVYPVLVPPTQPIDPNTPSAPMQCQEAMMEEQAVENPLATLEQSLIEQQDLVNRRRVAFYILLGLIVLGWFVTANTCAKI